MPWCGVPFPRRLGGGRPRYLAILEGLLSSMAAKGYSTEPSSIHYVRCMAAAREIAATWSTNARIGHCRDPWRMDIETLVRWEKMLKLPVTRADTVYSRRARLANHFTLVGLPTLTSLCEAQARLAVGSRFTAIEHVPPASVNVTVPDATYPFGTVSTAAPWSSTACMMIVLCTKLDADTEGSFYEAMGRLTAALDPLMPSWMTFHWYRRPVSTPIAVAGGPSMAGFYLDDEHNLDNCVFDV